MLPASTPIRPDRPQRPSRPILSFCPFQGTSACQVLGAEVKLEMCAGLHALPHARCSEHLRGRIRSQIGTCASLQDPGTWRRDLSPRPPPQKLGRGSHAGNSKPMGATFSTATPVAGKDCGQQPRASTLCSGKIGTQFKRKDCLKMYIILTTTIFAEPPAALPGLEIRSRWCRLFLGCLGCRNGYAAKERGHNSAAPGKLEPNSGLGSVLKYISH